MELYKACYMWRKFAGLTQANIYGEKKVKIVSAFENGRSTNMQHFERYYSLALVLGQKEDFEYFVQYVIETGIKRGTIEVKNNG